MVNEPGERLIALDSAVVYDSAPMGHTTTPN
jgi:hypothetical protein